MAQSTHEAYLTRCRFAEMFGETDLLYKLAKLFGRNRTAIYRWFREGFPEYAVLALELLDAVPGHKLDQIRKRIDPEFAANTIYMESLKGRADG